ncbi:hypothetical protein METBIDRAFT_34303, partial [Metschnikowia bicuspidata var. bicuspidata NRRL YB-4993]
PAEAHLHLHDKRHTRSRFNWVRRLVQGQNRGLPTGMRTPPYEPTAAADGRPQIPHAEDGQARRSPRTADFASDDESMSVHLDNLSTTPLKLITSHTLTTNPPSVLSADNQQPDSGSMAALTAETSLSPSTHVSLSPSVRGYNRDREAAGNRDSESIVTLASSTRRVRRRSIDTNCSMAGIPPASIMERLSGVPACAGDGQEAETR